MCGKKKYVLSAIFSVLTFPLDSNGAIVFQDRKCAVCHSIADKGNTKGPLDKVGSKYTKAELEQWLRMPEDMAKKTGATRKPPMKKVALTDDEVAALVDYLGGLR